MTTVLSDFGTAANHLVKYENLSNEELGRERTLLEKDLSDIKTFVLQFFDDEANLSGLKDEERSSVALLAMICRVSQDICDLEGDNTSDRGDIELRRKAWGMVPRSVQEIVKKHLWFACGSPQGIDNDFSGVAIAATKRRDGSKIRVPLTLVIHSLAHAALQTTETSDYGKVLRRYVAIERQRAVIYDSDSTYEVVRADVLVKEKGKRRKVVSGFGDFETAHSMTAFLGSATELPVSIADGVVDAVDALALQFFSDEANLSGLGDEERASVALLAMICSVARDICDLSDTASDKGKLELRQKAWGMLPRRVQEIAKSHLWVACGSPQGIDDDFSGVAINATKRKDGSIIRVPLTILIHSLAHAALETADTSRYGNVLRNYVQIEQRRAKFVDQSVLDVIEQAKYIGEHLLFKSPKKGEVSSSLRAKGEVQGEREDYPLIGRMREWDSGINSKNRLEELKDEWGTAVELASAYYQHKKVTPDPKALKDAWFACAWDRSTPFSTLPGVFDVFDATGEEKYQVIAAPE